MRLPFRQGIIRYPYSGNVQQFLQVNGATVDLSTPNGPTEVTFAHRSANYLYTENADVPSAWPGLSSGNIYWLYWNIDLLTGARTFGSTTVQPVFGPTEPSSPASDLHWYDTTNEIMYVYQGSAFVEVVRVFAAKYVFDGAMFSSLSLGLTNLPFAGSQVGLTDASNLSGRIIFDDNGKIIKRSSGELFTTEDQFFAAGSRVNTIRLESNVHLGTANENIAAFNIVKYVTGGKIELAGYADIGTTILGIAVEGILLGTVGSVILQGVVTNPGWNWTTIGANLWVSVNGALVTVDPNISDPNTYSKKQVPIARILSQTEIIFEQGLGGIGETGPQGVGATTNASNTEKGVVFLSVPPAGSPITSIAVGTNDPRMEDARTPLSHIHSASAITFAPISGIVSTEVQAAFAEVLPLAGGTLTGFLTLNANPTADLHAASKQYVDSLVSGLLWINPVHYVNLISDTVTSPPVSPEISDAYIVPGGATGDWSGLDGKIVVWVGGSPGWQVDTHPGSGLLSDHNVGEQFGVSIDSSTAASGSFIGKETQIAVLDSPSTPTWSFYTPVDNNAFFVENHESSKAFFQYAYNGTTNNWVIIGGGTSGTTFTPGTNLVLSGSVLNVSPQGAGSGLDADTLDGKEASVLSSYDLAGQIVGKPTVGAVIFRFIAVRAFTITASGHKAQADTASTGTSVFDIQINGVSVGNMTFTTSATGVITLTGSPAARSIVIDDIITIIASGSGSPATSDLTLSDIEYTLLGQL